MRWMIGVQMALAMLACGLAGPAVAQGGPPALTGVVWLERPNARDFERYYPPDARAQSVEGRVALDCLVDAEGRVTCAVATEDPLGWGFGEAALRISRYFRMAAATRDGRPTSGGSVRVTIAFRLA